MTTSRGRALLRGVSAGLEALVSLVLPVDCAGCGAADLSLCPLCRAALEVAPRWMTRPTLAGGPPVVTGADYGGRVSRVVIAWKDRGRHDLTRPLGRCLGRSVAAVIGCRPPGETRPVLLVPVPSTPAARRRRGEDLVASLARAAVAELDAGGSGRGVSPPVEVTPGALRVVRRVRDQSGLTAAERAHNLRGAHAPSAWFAARAAGRPCIVVDDILTTGATIAEASRAVRWTGARVVGIATLCATPLRTTPHVRVTED